MAKGTGRTSKPKTPSAKPRNRGPNPRKPGKGNLPRGIGANSTYGKIADELAKKLKSGQLTPSQYNRRLKQAMKTDKAMGLAEENTRRLIGSQAISEGAGILGGTAITSAKTGIQAADNANQRKSDNDRIKSLLDYAKVAQKGRDDDSHTVTSGSKNDNSSSEDFDWAALMQQIGATR